MFATTDIQMVASLFDPSLQIMNYVFQNNDLKQLYDLIDAYQNPTKTVTETYDNENSFTLSTQNEPKNIYCLAKNGVVLSPNEYTVSGNEITFNEYLDNDCIVITYRY